jgi:hypothetical protein
MVQVTGSVIALPLAPLVALMVTSASAVAAVAALPAMKKAAAETPTANKKVAARVTVRTGHPSKIKYVNDLIL